MKKHDIKVKVIRGRTIEKGQRGTLQVAPEQGNLINEATFKHMTSSKTRVFKGFIELVGVVKVKNINHLIKDRAVFLVDPSYDGHLVFNPKNNDAPGAFWRLEDNQMVAY